MTTFATFDDKFREFEKISRITSYLFLCGHAPVSKQAINRYGITCIIDISNIDKDGLNYDEGHVTDYMRIEVDDIEQTDLSPYFVPVADKIEETRKNGGCVLVHCWAGISRSSSLCLAYFMRHHNLTLAEAHELVSSKRPSIRPNDSFWKQLIGHEAEIHGKTTVDLKPSVSEPVFNRGRKVEELHKTVKCEFY